MGPGFDSLGFALNLYNVYEFKEIDYGLVFRGFDEEYCNEKNIIYKTMIKCFNKYGYKLKGLEISEKNRDIPVSRGLGSSSACIVSGIIAANEIMGNIMSKDDILNLAVNIEGHPDNVAPAILGGVVIAVKEEGKTYYQKIEPKNNLKYFPIIPSFKLKTEESRKVLPKTLSYKDAIYNISRTGMLIAALLNGDNSVLKYACKDLMHEPYRSKLIEGINLIKEEAYNNGAVASFLSGAGPTIMTVISENKFYKDSIEKMLKKENLAYEVLELCLDLDGAKIEGGN